MYVERRYRKFYAVLDVPKDVRERIGRRRFVQSLKTEIRSVAERRAAHLVAGWKLKIERARAAGHRDPLEDEALYWKEALALAKDADERELILSFIADKANETVASSAPAGEVGRPGETAWDDLPGQEAAQAFYQVATGRLVPLTEHLDEWLSISRATAKTKDMQRADVQRLATKFPNVQDVNRKDVRRWVTGLMNEDGLKPKTVQRILSAIRGYWRHLQSIAVVSDEYEPFSKLDVARQNNRAAPRSARKPFEPVDVVKLLDAAIERGDDQLANLIRLGMWTGCRIEELCALRSEQVRGDYFSIEDAKTEAGQRDVPLHPELTETVVRLLDDSKDGYVLSGLTLNKYGDRSNAIGKRFGRLKADLGFSPQYVFHSIRKTVVTILENAGVPENVVADIVGHEKPSITYGLYSGGASLDTKRAALAKLVYPIKREAPTSERLPAGA